MTLKEFYEHIRSEGGKTLGAVGLWADTDWNCSYVKDSIVFHATSTKGVIEIDTDLKDFGGYVEEMKQSLGMK